MMDHFYDVDFSLDAVRDAAAPDHSCQGTVQRAIAAFLASDSFVDAIRKAVSLGGDRVGTATVTGAVARVYYAVQTGNSPAGQRINLIRPCWRSKSRLSASCRRNA